VDSGIVMCRNPAKACCRRSFGESEMGDGSVLGCIHARAIDCGRDHAIVPAPRYRAIVPTPRWNPPRSRPGGNSPRGRHVNSFGVESARTASAAS
jgi:hypothetical protein